MTRFSLSPIAVALAAAVAVPTLANERETNRLETISVIGDAEGIRSLPGSAHLIDTEELAKFEFVDINRMVRGVPGVYILEEEGYGLRPNISIRGSGSGRTSKLSVMEDGVLVAPAPYADPAAYYFPSAGRLDSIEVLKGPASLKYGPFTVGGALNMLSTPIPDAQRGLVKLEAGEYGETRLHTHYGASTDTSGWLVETQQQYADGFADIDRGGDGDIAKQDYLLKGRLNSAADARYQQQLDVKLQYSEEESGMSYVGLTDADFKRNPNRRYGLTELDEMQNRHRTLQLNHSIALSESFSLHTQAYHNKFKRNWYKVDRINGAGAGATLALANAGDADALAVLHGELDADVAIKHNNREYDAKGVQVSAKWQFATGAVAHDLNFGLRHHEDESDRYQPLENFRQTDGRLVYQDTSLPGAGDNRVGKASAKSFFVTDEMRLSEALTLTAALRYEDVELSEQRYLDTGRNQKGASAKNQVDKWLPGLGLVYALGEQWSLIAGVHRGFAPPGAGSENIGPELSVNYEAGARFGGELLRAEAIVFLSDYQNAIRNCSIANPCAGGVDSGTQQLGEAEIKGLELSLGSDWTLGNGWVVPLSASYTYTEAEITRDSDTGDMLKGDNFDYLPENVFALSTGLDSGAAWRLYLTAAYQDDMCVHTQCNRGGTDRFDRTESLWVWDAAAHYAFSESVSGYLKVDNLFDEQAIVNRGPIGARPNRPRTATVGVKFVF